MQDLNFVYFGGEPLGVPVLEELKASGLLPKLIVCNPDRPVGRKQVLTPPPVKVWAEENNIEVFQPESYKDDVARTKLESSEWDLFVVVAYNFILPDWLLSIPKKQVINVHPSMLPCLRGASPIRTALKDGLRDQIGVSIMVMDEEMDHGPILNQLATPISDENWPVPGPELDDALAHTGGALLAATIADWMDGNIEPQEQDHDAATYCSKLSKADSELTIDPHNLPEGEDAMNALQQIRAFQGIGDSFFIFNDKRVKVKLANISDDKLEIITVVPEGKGEMSFTDYLENHASS